MMTLQQFSPEHPPVELADRKVRVAISRYIYPDKLPKDGDWERLNTSFVNCEVSAMQLANAVYTGHPFCAWLQPQGDALSWGQPAMRRHTDNWHSAQHVGIDLDTGDYRSSFEALADHWLVKSYGALLYETPNHTPEAPRTRVVFLLDSPITDRTLYGELQASLTAAFDGADPAAVDVVRFFYGNAKLAAAQHTGGIWLTEHINLPAREALALAAQRAILNRKHTLSPANGNGAKRVDAKPPPELDEVMDRLDHVDSYALHYDGWCKVIAALGHTFGDSAYGQAAAWSDKPGKQPLTWGKWQSLTASHNKPATLATVYAVLKQFGV